MKTHDSLPSAPRENKPTVAKRLGLGAFSISLLVHGLFALVAILFLYKWVYPPEAEAITTPGSLSGGGTEGATVSKVQIQHRQSLASALNPQIRSTAPSNLVLPDSSPKMADVALPVSMNNLGSAGQGGGAGGGNGPGNGPGNGLGNGLGIGPGAGAGFMTPFGGNIAVDGSLPGRFYDFKQTAKGKPTEGYEIGRSIDYSSRVNDIQSAGFRDLAFRKFYQAPDTLYLTQIAIATTDANAAPEFFNVADKVKPSGWLIHYKGSVSVNRDITFRFAGAADDYLGVAAKGHMVLISAWPSLRGEVSQRWKAELPIDDQGASHIPGSGLTTGNWIKLKRGESLDLSIGIGERPGGKVGFALLIEEKGVEYRTGSNGAKVLPLFTTQPISQTTRDRITKDFKNWEFEWENVPVFAVDKASGMGSDFR
ncbi:MAG: hypothetical protein ABIT37_02160 [Luteolibacter sp.]